MLKVSGHRDRLSAHRFRSGDEIHGLGPPGNHQYRTLRSFMQVFHWRPTLRLYINIRSAAKVGGVRDKNPQKKAKNF